MIAFEVSRNGVKLCTAGIGNFGVLTAIISWVAHDPESLTRLADQGLLEISPTEMALDVGGLKSFLSGDSESLKWTGAELSVGDEIVIRIVEVTKVDDPRETTSAETDDQTKAKIRQVANDVEQEMGESPG